MYFKFFITLLPVLMINLILMRIRILDPHPGSALKKCIRIWIQGISLKSTNFFLAKIVDPHILEDPDPGSQNLADPMDP